MKVKKIISLIFVMCFMLLIIPNVFAISKHIYILGAEENNGSLIGMVADLDLEIRPGNGRMFFDSFPLTDIDTQVSARFAKEFSCDFLNIDCSNLDFFYTISSTGPLVGGPSAGSAMTVLTIATLDNLEINQTVTMTGTISSAGTIGPVGGIEEKILAAEKDNFKIVIVPKWVELSKPEVEAVSIFEHKNSDNDTNNSNNNENILDRTKNLLEQKASLETYFNKISVVRAYNIMDALYLFTGKNYSKNVLLTMPEIYSETMKSFSDKLCEKTNFLIERNNISFEYDFNHSENLKRFENISHSLFINSSNTSLVEDYKKLSLILKAYESYNNSINAKENKNSYSAASFCFVTNVFLSEIELSDANNETLKQILETVKDDIHRINDNVESENINSIMKLQTRQIVKERLIEAEERILEEENSSTPNLVAYVRERVYSADVWTGFFNISSKIEEIDQHVLRKVCALKIIEAQERVAYLETVVPVGFQELHDKIDTASNLAKKEEFDLCIYSASQAKAGADLMLNTAFLSNFEIDGFLEDKFQVVSNLLANELSHNVFPIAGLSYLEYAKSLQKTDKGSALLYLEYAAELGKISMYFPKENRLNPYKFYFNDTNIMNFVLLVSVVISIITILLFFAFVIIFRKKNKSK